ncbi:hypothetical protein [Amphritea balenae]|uniref:4Fe-4S ferredoxin-type domain-containing protein n=1 Tax=Amphritea balenae TaxID=452629 RepID=A0A3P1SJ72_9GAMM|nr:hypothetical protein [Amphritea balenae]RRC97106.1 hypothetical protein EHS89_19345 [Amphritea balenae]GGK68067.1 hypothetical protein GCM10007941_17770 [Amphritea balenae]
MKDSGSEASVVKNAKPQVNTARLIDRLSEKLAEQGLLIRSQLSLDVDDPLFPECLSESLTDEPDEERSKMAESTQDSCVVTLLLIGNVGSSLWPAFSQSPEYQDLLPDPLDRWSLRVGRQLAEEFDARVLFPFGGPPYHPFLSWAKRNDTGFESPLGLTLHPEFGLWHAYRFALAYSGNIDIEAGLDDYQKRADVISPCSNCPDSKVREHNCKEKPCLSSCPVDAFSYQGYQVKRCAAFLAQNPEHDCNLKGCRARRACPVGQNYHYDDLHAQFHMRQFVVSH